MNTRSGEFGRYALRRLSIYKEKMAQSQRDSYSDSMEARLLRTIETTAVLNSRIDQLQGRLEGVEESFRSVARLVKLQQNFLESQPLLTSRSKSDSLESRMIRLEELYITGREEDHQRTEIGLRTVQSQVENMLRLWNAKVNERLETDTSERPTLTEDMDFTIHRLIDDTSKLKKQVDKLDLALSSLDLNSESANDSRLERIENILINAIEKMSTMERRTIHDRNEFETNITQKVSHCIDRFAASLQAYSEEQRLLQSTVNELIHSSRENRRSKSVLGGMKNVSKSPDVGKKYTKRQKSVRKLDSEK